MFSAARMSVITCLFVPLALGCVRDDADTVPPPAAEPAETPATAGQATMPADLVTRTEQYTAAWNGSDPAAVAQYFTQDATARVGDDTFSGRQEIQNGWLQNVPNIRDLEIFEARSEQRGEDYYAEGTYTHAVVEEGPSTGGTNGRYTVTWTRDADGQWRIRSTEVMPSPPAQP
jgi:uncharacterized protein (TIGR02246 family)